MTSDLSLNDLFQLCGSRLEKVFTYYLQDVPSLELKMAMETSLSNHGKFLRPLLIYATGCIFDASWENLDIPAAAVELIHTYSLIHDDLPAMDDADIRRGKPSCHKAFGEALAILTGDALHTLALEVIADYPAPIKDEKRLRMLKVLSHAGGPFGLAAGQALDMTLMNNDSISSDLLLEIYKLKTGALFTACMELGWLCSDDDDELNHRALIEFGECMGLAFQIQDDILDVEIESAALGKPQGADVKNKKFTYPKLHGRLQAKEKVQSLYEAALEAINFLGLRAQLLRELAMYILERKK